ncbi:hypothetical protein TRFO_35619 [Tritrichomonas foetus]|uniref:Uncharacterized protein n=1 Tax=Tritrichomonas foetus TaxID=1144522 RepID=A0A1J4JKH1_9EUKA|nr:hypothetical protein TRFO_35619 [Tritrichomonas foetus]|eukprot:OHS98051.1 hypothetical protein TRFO_35619 [Tritrichomonas foetus]
MSFASEQIPLFPASFVDENIGVIDYSQYDTVAVASGNTVTFSYVKNFALRQSFSIVVGESPVTALKFHQSNKFIIIGDSKGILYAYNFHKHQFIAKPYSRSASNSGFAQSHSNGNLSTLSLMNSSNSDNSAVQQIERFEGGLLVYYKSGHLVFYTIFQKNDTNQLLYNCLWETQTPEVLTHFTIDPFRHNRIFMYGKNSRTLQVYVVNDIHRPAKATSPPLDLNEGILLQNAQFSYHLQDYIFLVTEESIMLYNVELSIVVPLSHHQNATSLLTNIVQFHTDHSKILLFHRSGSISLLHLQKPFSLFSMTEINHQLQTQDLISYKLSPTRDDILICVYKPIGLALLDLNTFKFVSISTMWCDKILSFSTDGERYIFGTNKGYVVTGNMYNIEDRMAFHISNKPVYFVSNSSPVKNRVFWENGESVGEIDLADHRVQHYPERSLRLERAVDSSCGALAVKREGDIIGIFIEGNEQIFTAPGQIIDFCFDDLHSSTIEGKIMVLVENNMILFFNYSKTEGITNAIIKKAVDMPSQPLCCAWNGKSFAIGYEDGFIVVYKANDANLTGPIANAKVAIKNNFPIKKIQFKGSFIYVLSGDENIYKINNKLNVSKVSSEAVLNFIVVNTGQIMCMGKGNSIFFIHAEDGSPILSNSKSLSVPTTKNIFMQRILNNPILFSDFRRKDANNKNDINNHEENNHFNSSYINDLPFPLLHQMNGNKKPAFDKRSLIYMTKEGRDFWMQLLGRPSLKHMLQYAAGDSRLYDDTICDILLLGNCEESHQVILYRNLLFSNRIEEAVSVLSRVKAASHSFLLSTIISVAALSFEEDGINDEQCARLKSAGISLILNEKSREGSLLLRLAKLDTVAVEYLLQSDKISEAMKFVRSTLTKEEKQHACFQIAMKFFTNGKFKEAMMFFLTAQEETIALYCLKKMKRADDAFIIKNFLKENGLLRKISPEKVKMLGFSIDIKQLENSIDKAFSTMIEKRGGDVSKFFSKK